MPHVAISDRDAAHPSAHRRPPTLGQRLLTGLRSHTLGWDFAGLLLATAVLRLPMLFVSVIDWDESAFAIAAREVLHGHLPYITFFDNKPVGSSSLLAVAFGLFGTSVETIRLVGMLAVAATCWGIYLIARRCGGGRAVSLSAAALYIAFSTRLSGTATMTEIMLAPFTAAAVLLLIRLQALSGRTARLLTSLAAGLLFGIAVWIKYVPLAPAACVGLACLLEMLVRRRVVRTQAIAVGLAFALGVAAPTLATVLCYGRAGLLPTFWYANFGYLGHYVGIARDHTVRGALTETLLTFWPLAILVGLIVLPSVTRALLGGERRYPVMIVGAWLFGEAVAAIAPLQFYPHYFLMPLPPLCLLAALVLWRGVGAMVMTTQAGRAMAASTVAIMLVPLTHHAVDAARALTRPDIPRQVAALARRTVRPGETLYVVNDQPIIYILAHATLPTAYAFPTDLIGPQRDIVPVDRLAELSRVLATRPRMIVLDAAAGWTDPIKVDLAGRQMVEAALAASYDGVATFTTGDGLIDTRVFVRRD
jgi:hypothetical protein